VVHPIYKYRLPAGTVVHNALRGNILAADDISEAIKQAQIPSKNVQDYSDKNTLNVTIVFRCSEEKIIYDLKCAVTPTTKLP